MDILDDLCFACNGSGYFDGGDMRDDEICNSCGGTGIAKDKS